MVRQGVTVEPHPRLTFTVQGLDDWVADALDSVYNTSGTAIVNNKTDHGRHLGAEFDGYTWYELNKHFNLGGGGGYFGGGQFLTNVTTSHAYTYYYICAELQRQRKASSQTPFAQQPACPSTRPHSSLAIAKRFKTSGQPIPRLPLQFF